MPVTATVLITNEQGETQRCELGLGSEVEVSLGEYKGTFRLEGVEDPEEEDKIAGLEEKLAEEKCEVSRLRKALLDNLGVSS